MNGAWEHVAVRFGTDSPKGWQSATTAQMEVVRDLQRVGFECAAMSTLADGSLYLMFKRPALGQEPPEIEEGDGVSIGLYL